ncbi:expressed unknown protein [Seminavis robusta]|uniref:Uncharacterized protein n=1 Tax=Seminavis robusta TaxID=568900 RepID=A0A9N8EDR9_9STRA|nr:expressed unknown protein [Seminavis robusta]|eukprot:Sro855_g211350.1 n/a (236) ;mRNA; r:9633-10340
MMMKPDIATTVEETPSTQLLKWPRRRSTRTMLHKKISAETTLPEEEDLTGFGDSYSSRDASGVFERPQRRRSCLKKSLSTEEPSKGGVSFGSVHVHEFAVCVGDNPAVSVGVPITIEWKPQWSGKYSVNDYDHLVNSGKSKTPPLFTALQRYCILRDAGYTNEMITKVERATRNIKRDRAITIQRFHMDPFEEALERLGKSAWNAVFARQQKQDQREILAKCLEHDKAYCEEIEI